MANKSKHQKLFDSALKTGDWQPAEAVHRAELLQSSASIRANRKQANTFAVSTEPVEPEDEIAPDLALDDTEAETPSECLRDAYEAYTKAGGNRFIREKVLAHFDGIEIEATDRAAQREAAEKLFPGSGEHLWDDEVFAPIIEVKTFWRRQRPRPKVAGRYQRPWGINNGTRGYRDGVGPSRHRLTAPPQAGRRLGLRVRHLTGQPYGKKPVERDCIGTQRVNILSAPAFYEEPEPLLYSNQGAWPVRLEILSDRIELTPYRQWAHEPPAGPYPFEAKLDRETNHPKRPPVSAEWDEREAATQNTARRIDPIRISPDGELVGDMPAKITRSLARQIRRRDQLAASSQRARHDAPLGEIAVPVTNAQRERYKLAPYTTALQRPREMLIADPIAFELEHGLTGARRFMLYRRVWGEQKKPLLFGPPPGTKLVPRTHKQQDIYERRQAMMESHRVLQGAEWPVTICPPYYGHEARPPGRPRLNKVKVPKRVGRPRVEPSRVLDAAERQQRRYAKKKHLRLVAAGERVHFTPRLAAWMRNNLKTETLSMMKAA